MGPPSSEREAQKKAIKEIFLKRAPPAGAHSPQWSLGLSPPSGLVFIMLLKTWIISKKPNMQKKNTTFQRIQRNSVEVEFEVES